MKNSQQDLINFVNDPENIRKAVEGSMDKRNAVMNPANQTPQSTFDEKLESIGETLVTDVEGGEEKAMIYFKAAITSLILEEVINSRIMEDWMPTAKDVGVSTDVIQRFQDAAEIREEFRAQQRSIITKELK